MASASAIVSGACRSVGMLMTSQAGDVSPGGEVKALQNLLGKALSAGSIAVGKRKQLAEWGPCLGAKAGASCLGGVIRHVQGNELCPAPSSSVSNQWGGG